MLSWIRHRWMANIVTWNDSTLISMMNLRSKTSCTCDRSWPLMFPNISRKYMLLHLYVCKFAADDAWNSTVRSCKDWMFLYAFKIRFKLAGILFQALSNALFPLRSLNPRLDKWKVMSAYILEYRDEFIKQPEITLRHTRSHETTNRIWFAAQRVLWNKDG